MLFTAPNDLRLPDIPDDLTIPQFMFNFQHAIRPTRNVGTPCIIEDATGRNISMEELRRRVDGLSNALKIKYDIGEDDVVLIFSPNHVDYPVVIWASHQIGAIISGANPAFQTNELVYQLKETKAKLVIADPGSLATTLEAAKEVGLSADRVVLFNTSALPRKTPHTNIESLVQEGSKTEQKFVERKFRPGEAKTKLAFLSFSSGTTGRPKAVAIPHYPLIANVMQIAVHNRINEDYAPWKDRRFRPGDVTMADIYGLVVNMHFMVFAAMSLVVIPKFEFVSMLKSIVRHRITHLIIVPPQAIHLCKHPAVKDYDLSVVRMIMTGAAPLSEEINHQLFKNFPDAHIGQAFGMTEVCTAVTWFSINNKRGVSGASGTLLPGVTAKVVKEDGSLAKYGEEGELYIKSPSNALKYANNEQATAETFLDGWVRSGDEVIIRADGEVFVIDRLKEIMKVRGFQVAPAELEGCILDHPAVSDVCVVGIPDDYSGEVPLAFVVLTVDAAKKCAKDKKASETIKQSIMKHVADNKIHYKRLKGGVEYVDVIPKNPSGKLLRRLLRDQAKELVKHRQTKAKL